MPLPTWQIVSSEEFGRYEKVCTFCRSVHAGTEELPLQQIDRILDIIGCFEDTKASLEERARKMEGVTVVSFVHVVCTEKQLFVALSYGRQSVAPFGRYARQHHVLALWEIDAQQLERLRAEDLVFEDVQNIEMQSFEISFSQLPESVQAMLRTGMPGTVVSRTVDAQGRVVDERIEVNETPALVVDGRIVVLPEGVDE